LKLATATAAKGAPYPSSLSITMAETCVFPVSTKSRAALLAAVPHGVFSLCSAPTCTATLTPTLELHDHEGRRWTSVEAWAHAMAPDACLEEELLFGNGVGFEMIAAISCAAHELTIETWTRECALYRLYAHVCKPPATDPSTPTSFADRMLSFVATFRAGRYAFSAAAAAIDEELYTDAPLSEERLVAHAYEAIRQRFTDNRERIKSLRQQMMQMLLGTTPFHIPLFDYLAQSHRLALEADDKLLKGLVDAFAKVHANSKMPFEEQLARLQELAEL
jgi:hypothetical protein